MTHSLAKQVALGGALLGFLLPAQSADAQQPKPNPKPTAAAAPAPAAAPQPGQAPASKTVVPKGVDASSYMQAAQEEKVEGFIAEKEREISEKRQAMMRGLVSILAKYPPGPQKAGVLFRLAEQEWEEARYRYLAARKRYEKEYEAFLDGSVKVQPVEPKPVYSSALNYYKQILREYPPSFSFPAWIRPYPR